MIGISLKRRKLSAGFVQPGSCVCIVSPEKSTKWGPGAPQSPGFSGERERPLFWSKEPRQLFQPLGSASSFPLSNIHENNQGQPRPDLEASGALDLDRLSPPGPGTGWGVRLANSGIFPNSLDSPGFRKKFGRRGKHGGKAGKKNSPNEITLVAEPVGEGRLSGASWEPGAQRRSPGRRTRVESINITTIDTININTGKHLKSVQRFFLGPFFIVGPGVRLEGRGAQVSGGEFLQIPGQRTGHCQRGGGQAAGDRAEQRGHGQAEEAVT